MKNKKLFAALLPSLMIIVFMMGTAVRVMLKYRDTPGDWHFIAASVSVAGFLLLLITFINKLRKVQGAEVSDTTKTGSATAAGHTKNNV